MSIIDSYTLISIVGERHQLVITGVTIVAILATVVVYYTLDSKSTEHGFPKLRGIQLYHAWNFFRRRNDFIRSVLKRNHGKSFSFKVLRHNVIVLTGEDARKGYFSGSHFDIRGGNELLQGIGPSVSNLTVRTEEEEEMSKSFLVKRFYQLTSKERMQDILPSLLRDIFGKADEWGNKGKSGRIDPFTEVYDVMFLMTARLSACRELTENDRDLKKMQRLLLDVETGYTPASLLLPWFPSPARTMVKNSTTELYTMLHTYVETRRHAQPTTDAIDVMIADGVPAQRIAAHIMATLFAGPVNSGMFPCWALIYLAIHTQWKEKCKKEINGLISRHAGNSPATLLEKLEVIPFSVWEDKLPVLDACLRESLRLAITVVSLRRNLGEGIKIDGRTIERGDFLVYSLNDAHLNPEYYPEPDKYDPGRWLEPNAVPDVVYPFLAWGAGRHPCVGMKLAKIMMKLVFATFLMRYEYKLVDKDGKFPDTFPVPNRNDTHRARPLVPCYLDIKKIAE